MTLSRYINLSKHHVKTAALQLAKVKNLFRKPTRESYAKMQREFYDKEAPKMSIENHQQHNSNPNLWDIGYAPLLRFPDRFKGGLALDFACGAGRNMGNISTFNLFSRIDGCDIALMNLEHAAYNLKVAHPNSNFNFYQTNGQSALPEVIDSYTPKYDFIFSTIALQHIPIRTTRNQIFSDFNLMLTSTGVLSFQMGFGGKKFGGKKRKGSVKYTANFTGAKFTNGMHDTRCEEPEILKKDLMDAGFVHVRWFITPSWEDRHPYWIWVWASNQELTTNVSGR